MSGTTSSVRRLPCPQCGGTISLRAAGSSVSLICEYCGSTLDATDPDLRLIKAASEALRKPGIALGRRGIVRGVLWEVVGYLERGTDDRSEWSEYLLFNPYLGYAFLVDDGHCIHFGRLIDRLPTIDGKRATLDGQEYLASGDGYWARVTFVVGEFYWRVAIGERAYVTEYARPGAMLSEESTDTELTWTRLELLDLGAVEQAFNLPKRRPFSSRHAPSPDEVSPWGRRLYEAVLIAAAAILFLLIVNRFGAAERLARAESEEILLDGPEATFVLRDIDVAPAHARVTVSADGSALANAWVDLDYSLVEQKTQQSYDAYGLAEYYRGADSDGPWTEGNAYPETQLAGVPRGRYDLIITASAHSWRASSASSFDQNGNPVPAPGSRLPIRFVATTGGTFIANFWLAVALILIWPGWLWIRHYNFKQRQREGF